MCHVKKTLAHGLLISLLFNSSALANYCATGTANLMFVCDVTRFVLRSVSPVNGQVTTIAGLDQTSGSVDANGVAARFSRIVSTTFSRDGTMLYIFDDCKIKSMTAVNGLYTVRTLATVCTMTTPEGFLVTSADNSKLYISIPANQVLVLSLATKSLSVLLGLNKGSSCSLGAASNADISYPGGMYASKTGSFLMIVSYSNHVVYKLDLLTNQLSVFAGSCGAGSMTLTNGVGTNVKFFKPYYITMTYDESTMFVSDQAGFTLRKITYPGAVVTTMISSIGNKISGMTISPDSAYLFFTGNFISTDITGVYRVTISSATFAAFSGSVTKGGVDGTATAAQFYNPGGISYFACGCFPGKYGLNSASTCSACPAGTYLPHYGALSVAECIACQSGKYNPSTGGSSTLACLVCAADTYSLSGSAGCSPCDPAVCGAGSYLSACGGGIAATCSLCPDGTYSFSGDATCSLCTAGTYSLSGATSCLPCAADWYSLDGASACSPCDPAVCEPGSYLSACGGGIPLTCTGCTNTNYTV